MHENTAHDNKRKVRFFLSEKITKNNVGQNEKETYYEEGEKMTEKKRTKQRKKKDKTVEHRLPLNGN